MNFGKKAKKFYKFSIVFFFKGKKAMKGIEIELNFLRFSYRQLDILTIKKIHFHYDRGELNDGVYILKFEYCFLFLWYFPILHQKMISI